MSSFISKMGICLDHSFFTTAIFTTTRLGKVVLQGEIGYNLTRKGMTSYEDNLQPWRYSSSNYSVWVPMKTKKFTDVAVLLEKHFGNDWRNLEALQWYINLVDRVEHEMWEMNVNVLNKRWCVWYLQKKVFFFLIHFFYYFLLKIIICDIFLKWKLLSACLNSMGINVHICVSISLFSFYFHAFVFSVFTFSAFFISSHFFY